jgi:putative transposase
VDLLKRGPERLGCETPLWTCWRVAHLIEKEFGVSYHDGHVWKVLRALHWSVQRPAATVMAFQLKWYCSTGSFPT